MGIDIMVIVIASTGFMLGLWGRIRNGEKKTVMRSPGTLATRRPASRPQRGMSYIEVLIAMLVLMVGILGAFGALTTAALDIYGGGRETGATEQAQAILERIRNAASYEDLLSYADVPPAGATSPRPGYVTQNRDAWLASLDAATPGGLPQGRGSITIAQQGALPNRLAVITVSVDWSGRTGPNPPTFVTQLAEWP